MILMIATDAALSAEFDRLMKLAYAANHAQPRTVESVATAKLHIAAMQKVSDEISQRAGIPLRAIALSDLIVDGVGSAVDGVGSAVNSLVFKGLAALAVLGFVLLQLKK